MILIYVWYEFVRGMARPQTGFLHAQEYEILWRGIPVCADSKLEAAIRLCEVPRFSVELESSEQIENFQKKLHRYFHFISLSFSAAFFSTWVSEYEFFSRSDSGRQAF